MISKSNASLNPGTVAAIKAKRALQVAQAIVLDIQSNAREIGDRLPQEEDMLARYEVARATLREALRFLELQGVIHLQLGRGGGPVVSRPQTRSEEHTSELQSLMRISYAVFCLKKKKIQ